MHFLLMDYISLYKAHISLLDTCCSLFMTNFSFLSPQDKLRIFHHLLLLFRGPTRMTHYILLMAHYSLLITHYLLLFVQLLLFVIIAYHLLGSRLLASAHAFFAHGLFLITYGSLLAFHHLLLIVHNQFLISLSLSLFSQDKLRIFHHLSFLVHGPTLMAHHLILISHCRQLITHCYLLITYCLLSLLITCLAHCSSLQLTYFLLIGYFSLLMAHCSLLITRCSLLMSNFFSLPHCILIISQKVILRNSWLISQNSHSEPSHDSGFGESPLQLPIFSAVSASTTPIQAGGAPLNDSYENNSNNLWGVVIFGRWMTPLGSEKNECGEEGGVLIYDCLFLALGAFLCSLKFSGGGGQGGHGVKLAKWLIESEWIWWDEGKKTRKKKLEWTLWMDLSARWSPLCSVLVKWKFVKLNILRFGEAK